MSEAVFCSTQHTDLCDAIQRAVCLNGNMHPEGCFYTQDGACIAYQQGAASTAPWSHRDYTSSKVA
jgi:hypothetical protein